VVRRVFGPLQLVPDRFRNKAFKKELKDYRISKGTIQFPVDKPLPADLVKKMVKARIAEMKGKKR